MNDQTPRFVSAAEITRNFGMWQDRAGQGPLVVTHHGRPRCVLLSAESYRAIAESGGIEREMGDDGRAAIEHALLAERIEAGLVEFDEMFGIVSVNALAALMLGQPGEAVVGRGLAEIAPTLATGLAGARLKRVTRDGEEAHFECPMPDGGALSVHAFPWSGGGGAMLLRRAGADDTGARAEARAGALDAALAAHGAIGIVRLTVRGTIEIVDAAFATLAGFEAARLKGVRAIDLMALRTRTALGDAIERVLTGGGPQALDSRLLVNGGDERSVRIALAPVPEGLAVSGAMMVMTAG